ncbi:hypothetical protein PISMIDRAFT_19707 [Pisolithus microcarpus 441]|uniref:Uncharacterized protein n=1 Tax=Pisolithus microcarpus 441 TaxID=765257 RepID=A0A0C9YTL0_9AGAM|nr:hypothetical protein BKA83DRAFT_19707 [Pisolithus microcarpus]KIK11238.1 hypothetical protein PISMIDRAFT_19707 [Pisolithus microcarpus 441]
MSGLDGRLATVGTNRPLLRWHNLVARWEADNCEHRPTVFKRPVDPKITSKTHLEFDENDTQSTRTVQENPFQHESKF